MKHALGFLILAVLTGSAGASAAIQPPSPRTARSEALAADPRLQVELAAAFADRPLSEILSHVAGKTGVPLSLGREVTADRLTLFLRRRPAVEVMGVIAAHLDLRWSRSRDGYLLSGARTRDLEALRRKDVAAAREWMDRLAKFMEAPEEPQYARRREVDRLLASPDLPAGERQALEEEQRLLADRFRHSRAVPAAVAVFRSLTPTQRQWLEAHGELRLASAFGGLSPEATALAYAALRPNSAEKEERMNADASFRFLDGPLASDRPRGARAPRLDVSLTAIRGTGSTSTLNWRPRFLPAGLEPHRQSERRSEAALQEQVALQWPPPPPAPTPARSGPAFHNHRQWPRGTVTLGQLCEAIHRKTGLELVADGFIRSRFEPGKAPAEGTVAGLLDAAAGELDYNLDYQGERVRLWSRSRVYDRAAEVPETVLQPLRKAESLELDHLAAAAAALTDAQVRSLGDFWGWYLEGTGHQPSWSSGGLYDLRQHLRFWAGLDARQQRLAAIGQLTTRELRPPQQRLFQLAASAVGDDLSGSSLLEAPPAGALVGRIGEFRLSTEEREAQSYVNERGELSTMFRTKGARFDLFNASRFGGGMLTPVGPLLPLQSYRFHYRAIDAGGKSQPVRTLSVELLPRILPIE